MVRSRPEVTGRKISIAVERAAYTISEFCNAHRISRAHYYNLKRLGQGPDEVRAGDRTVLITIEAAARWRKQRTPAGKRSLDIKKLLKLGFADRIINSPEHPYVMQLRGLAE